MMIYAYPNSATKQSTEMLDDVDEIARCSLGRQ